MMPNHEKKWDYFMNLCLSKWWCKLIPIMVEWDGFLMKLKHQYHLFLREECVYDAQSWKERRLVCESMFIPIKRWASVLEMVIRDVFLMKPKRQYL